MNYMNTWGLVTPSNTLLRRKCISGDSPLLPQAIVIYWSKDESILLLRQYFDPCCCWIFLHTLLYADLCCCCWQKKGHSCERYTVPDGQRIYVYTILYNEVCWWTCCTRNSRYIVQKHMITMLDAIAVR